MRQRAHLAASSKLLRARSAVNDGVNGRQALEQRAKSGSISIGVHEKPRHAHPRGGKKAGELHDVAQALVGVDQKRTAREHAAVPCGHARRAGAHVARARTADCIEGPTFLALSKFKQRRGEPKARIGVGGITGERRPKLGLRILKASRPLFN